MPLKQALHHTWKWIKRHPWYTTGICVGIISSFLLGLFFLVGLGTFGPLPTYSELRQISKSTASEVYSADSVLIGKYYFQNRTLVPLNEISRTAVQALIATEDARFFHHKGIDFRSLARVLIKGVLLMDDDAGGGSTLSQQLAKNLYPRKKYFLGSILINKFREIWTARRLEKTYSKEELLELYLNTVPFGDNVFGIEVAAHRFYNIPSKKLNAAQSALLIGMLKGNSYYHPVHHPDRALIRRNEVLSRMFKFGTLNEEQFNWCKKQGLDLKYSLEGHNQGLATYFREHLRLELIDILEKYNTKHGTDLNLYTDGLKIYTTLDARMQTHAENAMRTHMKELQLQFNEHWKNKKPWGTDETLLKALRETEIYKSAIASGMNPKQAMAEMKKTRPMKLFTWDGPIEKILSPLDSIKHMIAILNCGIFSHDPRSGEVKVWVGGIDYNFFQYDHTLSRRQVGSTFKPVVYLNALLKGFLPCDYFENIKHTYPRYDDWSPANADGKYGGYHSMAGALAESINTISAWLITHSNIEDAAQLAEKMGCTKVIQEPSIALGTNESNLQEMTTVYGTLANQGVRPLLRWLKKIKSRDGKLLRDFTPPAQKEPVTPDHVVSPFHCQLMTGMLQHVVDSGGSTRLKTRYGIQFPMAGKTGTSQNQMDAWFIGYTPGLVTGVWVGADNPSVRFRSLALGQGAAAALPIYGLMMHQVAGDPKLKKYVQFPRPELDSLQTFLLSCAHEKDSLSVFAPPPALEKKKNVLTFIKKIFGAKDPPPTDWPVLYGRPEVKITPELLEVRRNEIGKYIHGDRN